MHTLFLEPFGGLAGDMLLAALLDLDSERFRLAHLEELAQALVPGECSLVRSEVLRGGLRATHLEVRTPESGAPPHRHLSDLLGILERVPEELLSAEGRARAGDVLTRLAQAEACVHGISVEAVHFHEVGAVDTLIDVAGAVLGLERLGCECVRCTPPYVGGGTIHCAHGEMPVPAPATLELLRGRPFRRGVGGERLTPTAAALLAVLSEAEGQVASGGASEREVLGPIGIGAGTRDPKEGPPNLCRVSLVVADRDGMRRDEPVRRAVWLGASNLDDVTGEEVGFLLERLRGAGALDVWSQAVSMKKGRPGVVVSVLARAGQRAELEALFFEHTPTLGVRWSYHERSECERQIREIDIGGVRVRIKLRFRPVDGDGVARARDLSPEYDDLVSLAEATGRTLRELEREVIDAALGDAAFLATVRPQAR